MDAEIKQLRADIEQMCRALEMCPKCKVRAHDPASSIAIAWLVPPPLKCPICGNEVPRCKRNTPQAVLAQASATGKCEKR